MTRARDLPSPPARMPAFVAIAMAGVTLLTAGCATGPREGTESAPWFAGERAAIRASSDRVPLLSDIPRRPDDIRSRAEFVEASRQVLNEAEGIAELRTRPGPETSAEEFAAAARAEVADTVAAYDALLGEAATSTGDESR